ncbi:MAG: hexitol phosphatase HxpB [Crocinitomicaceae bacterium]|nr:hexitol phosphatase HxpB [Crocinitomicaceae bacterium]
MIEAILFDMDGLLIDSEPLWKEAEIKVFGSVGIDMNERSCEQTVGLRIDQVVDLWYSSHPWDNKSKQQVIQEILEEMQMLIRTKGKAKKGVEEIFQFLEGKNLKKAIASSSYLVLIEAVLDKLNLREQIDLHKSAEHEEFGKPHPALFLNTAKELNAYHEHCLVFEDSFNGVLAAKAARMKVVAVPEETHLKDPRMIIADLQIESLLDFDQAKLDAINESLVLK